MASWLQDIQPLNWPQVLWKCSNEGQELSVPLRNTPRHFLVFMAEAHCQNTHGKTCTMSVPVPAEATGFHQQFLLKGGCFYPVLTAVLAASRSCQIDAFSTFVQLLQIFQYDCILQPQAPNVFQYQFKTNLVNNILNTVNTEPTPTCFANDLFIINTSRKFSTIN